MMADCVDPAGLFDAYAASADRLDAWHAQGRAGRAAAGAAATAPAAARSAGSPAGGRGCRWRSCTTPTAGRDRSAVRTATEPEHQAQRVQPLVRRPAGLGHRGVVRRRSVSRGRHGAKPVEARTASYQWGAQTPSVSRGPAGHAASGR